jgi:hypothetical protein
MCGRYPNMGNPLPYLGYPMYEKICKGCNKYEAYCMCKGTSNPYYDMQALEGVLPDGVSIQVDPSKIQETKPVKKWADELREIAVKVSEHRDYEGFSAYIYMLERCKLAAKHGECGIVYWKNNLHLWCKEELEIAADLLRKDNFAVEVAPMNDDIRIVVNW